MPRRVRDYAFDNNGNRTELKTTTHPDGDCASATGTTSTTLGYGYDDADRPTTSARIDLAAGTGSYVYDGFGRQTTLPADDAPDPAKGNITLAYYDSDLPQAITQNGTTTSYTLNVAGRRQVSTTGPTGGAATSITVRHYRNPAPGHPHGDVVTNITLPAAQDQATPCATIGPWSDYTEYGTPRETAATAAVSGSAGYGWLGAKERSTSVESAGLTLMGDRLYNATTGRFTSPDPEPGGNDTAYTYPNDPINMYDLDGRWGWLKKAARWAWDNRATIAAVSTLFCTICAAAMAVYAGYKAIRAASRGDWKGAAWQAAGAFGGGRALRGVTAVGARGARYSGKIYKTEAKAIRAAKRYRNKAPHTREYRGNNGVGDHVHVDTRRGGRIVHTRHYYWKGSGKCGSITKADSTLCRQAIQPM